MDINYSEHQGIKIFALEGDLDSTNSPEAYEEIRKQVVAQDKVIVDMSHVPYMSSGGIRTLLLLYRHVRDEEGNIVLVGLSDMIRETLDITGFLEYFETKESLEDGIQAVK